METELSFLINLLLNDDVPKDIRLFIKERIKLVEEEVNQKSFRSSFPGGSPRLQATPMRVGELPISVEVNGPETVPQVSVVSPQATAALAERNATIAQAISGKPMPGETGPRKLRGRL